MSLHIRREKGIALDKQRFDWLDLVRVPTSKLDDNAFTRLRVILLYGMESEAVRFSHAAARNSFALRRDLAELRRIEQHQQTLIKWLLPADLGAIELALSYAQTAIEVTASVAQREPDSYLAQVFRFGMLEDLDHLYRHAALYDRVYGGDANTLLQSYTDILPGRPTKLCHRAPQDELRRPYERQRAEPLSKLNALTMISLAQEGRELYLSLGSSFSDPIARALFAELASAKEQHLTQYESLLDPDETALERWLLQQACELYNYYSAFVQEKNPRIKTLWERFVQYELGHLHVVMELLAEREGRDPQALLPDELPAPIEYKSHRTFLSEVLKKEAELSARDADFVNRPDESEATRRYREQLNSAFSPSETVAAGYRYGPGGELALTPLGKRDESQHQGQRGRASHVRK